MVSFYEGMIVVLKGNRCLVRISVKTQTFHGWKVKLCLEVDLQMPSSINVNQIDFLKLKGIYFLLHVPVKSKC